LTAYAVRGLDINSSYTIYELLEKQKQKGVSVVYVGEDLDTLLALCDRILVLADGKLMGAVDARKISKNDVGLLMMGQNIETGKLLDPNRPYSGERSEGTDSEVTHE
jgi:simple sugar transport system ATP-binding protein